MDTEEVTIVIVDDEPHILKALERVFMAEENWNVVAHDSAESALEWLETGKVDIIISDERMPGMSGSEFLSKVRTLHPEVPRIILTGHADQTATIRAINDAGVFRYLQKPWNNDELKQVVRLALEHSRSLGLGAGMNLKLLAQKKQLEDMNRRLLEEAEQQRKKWDRAAMVIRQVASSQASHRTASMHIFMVVTALHAPEVMQLSRKIHDHVKSACLVLGLEFDSDMADASLLLPILGANNSQLDAFLGRVDGFQKVCSLFLDIRENYNSTGPRCVPAAQIPAGAMLIRVVNDYFHYEKEVPQSGVFMLHRYEYRLYDPKMVAAFLQTMEAGCMAASSMPEGTDFL